MGDTAKIFIKGKSQAVRLPAAYRFDTSEVFIRKDPATGDVILSRKPETWDEFFWAIQGVRDAGDFLSSHDRTQGTAQRLPFADWQE